MVLANTANQGWFIHQINIKNVYLNTELREDIHMKPPPGYLRPEDENKVCKLKKSLYGLRQASHKLYKTLTRSSVNHAIFH